MTTREERLMPKGIPRYIRCYDNGGVEKGGTADRYTVCYIGKKTGREDWYGYVGMNAAPFHPQGFCQHGESELRIDWPTYGHLGKKIRFGDLPTDCKKVVIDDYKEIWGTSTITTSYRKTPKTGQLMT